MRPRWRTAVLLVMLGGIAGGVWWIWPISCGFAEHRLEDGHDGEWKPMQRTIGSSGRTISVESRLVELDDAALTEYLRWGPLPEKAGVPVELNATQFHSLFRIAQSANCSWLTGPEIAAVEGVPTRSMITAQQAYVWNRRQDVSGGAILNPDVRTIKSGISVSVEAVALIPSSHLQLRARISLAQLRSLHNIPFPESPPGSNHYIQRPRIDERSIGLLDFETESGLWVLFLGPEIPQHNNSGVPINPASTAPVSKIRLLVLMKPTLIRKLPAHAIQPMEGK